MNELRKAIRLIRKLQTLYLLHRWHTEAMKAARNREPYRLDIALAQIDALNARI